VNFIVYSSKIVDNGFALVTRLEIVDNRFGIWYKIRLLCIGYCLCRMIVDNGFTLVMW